MKMRILLALLLASGFIAVILVIVFSGEDELPLGPRTFSRSQECEECHPEVFAEWKASWHYQAWLDPFVREKQMADNFKKKDCIPCHAPRPIFERGIRPGERVIERASNREDGVDCLSCHKLPEGRFAASTRDAQGPCEPVYHPLLTDTALCAPCHNQHNTVDEWMVSPPELMGEDCNWCHMPEKERKRADGKGTRIGRDHTFPGGHFREILLESFSLDHEITEEGEEKTLLVRIKNDKCGHNLPADSRHRALDLIVTFYKKGGLPFPWEGPPREVGQEPGTFRMRFRNPYRSETDKTNTQIPAGEERILEAPVPPGAQRALIQVIYKLRPFMSDADGEELAHREIRF
ncbi:MAG: cytochrome c3 family protein [Planctomycetota bacterium]|jgi:hypothetical protein